MITMKFRTKTLLILMLAVLALLAGCANGGTDNGTDGIANPWTESDQQGVLEATGFSMTAPEGASDVSYSYLAESGLAQMRYVLSDAEWVYRIQSAEELSDISGMEYEWTAEKAGSVAGKEAMYYAWSDADPDSETIDDAAGVQVVNWYDAVSGVTYSLSAAGKDLNGIDLQVFAEELYEPLQEEATDDADADAAEEIRSYFLGEHVRSYDESTLNIAENGDGSFDVDLSITRLCKLENGSGSFADHKIAFSVEDPNGNPMAGEIYRDSDNSLTVKITDSSWELLPNDEVIDGFGK